MAKAVATGMPLISAMSLVSAGTPAGSTLDQFVLAVLPLTKAEPFSSALLARHAIVIRAAAGQRRAADDFAIAADCSGNIRGVHDRRFRKRAAVKSGRDGFEPAVPVATTRELRCDPAMNCPESGAPNC